MKTENFRTIGFAMVKNEVDIIEPFVRHNMQFLDALIVFDHYSSDGTREVLLKLSREYNSVAVCTYDRDAHDQGELLTKQLAKFQQKFRADLAIFLDADEFIRFDDGIDFASCARDLSPGGVGLIPWRTYIPDPDAPITLAEPLDRFTLRRSREMPTYYKVLVRLNGATDSQFCITQGSHTVRTQSGKAIATKMLNGVHLMHFPVRSIAQLVAKSKIGSLTNSLRSDTRSKTQAYQWQRVADMERNGEIGEGNRFLFEEAMIYAQSSHDGNLHDNIEASGHGIAVVRRYSDGQRQSPEELYQAEVCRLQSREPPKRYWSIKRLFQSKTDDESDDLPSIQYLVRKYGQAGLFFDPDFGGLSGFSTASANGCAVHVRLVDEPPSDAFREVHFDTLVAQSLSFSKTLRHQLCVFARAQGTAEVPV